MPPRSRPMLGAAHRLPHFPPAFSSAFPLRVSLLLRRYMFAPASLRAKRLITSHRFRARRKNAAPPCSSVLSAFMIPLFPLWGNGSALLSLLHCQKISTPPSLKLLCFLFNFHSFAPLSCFFCFFFSLFCRASNTLHIGTFPIHSVFLLVLLPPLLLGFLLFRCF